MKKKVDYEEKKFNKIINGKKAKIIKLEKWGCGSIPKTNSLVKPFKDPEGQDFYPIAPNGQPGTWRKNPFKLDAEHIYWQKNSKGRVVPYEVVYYDEVKNKKAVNKTRTIFLDYGTTTDATKEILNYFNNNKLFDTAKPLKLLKKLITLSTNKEDIILDFFAGSGTTGDAIMQLNAEDGGKRRFILVQLDEPINPQKNKETYEFVKNELKAEPTIFEITKERLIRAAKKIETELNIKNGFKIFELQKKI